MSESEVWAARKARMPSFDPSMIFKGARFVSVLGSLPVAKFNPPPAYWLTDLAGEPVTIE